MPIVRMHHVGPDNLGGGQRGGAAEEDEALHIVGIVLAMLAVDIGAREKSRMLDHVHRHVMRIDRGEDRKTLDLIAELDRAIAQDGRRLDLVQNRRVAGNDQGRLMAYSLEGAWQRTDHVGEAAGFGMWRRFRGNNRDLHLIEFTRRIEAWSVVPEQSCHSGNENLFPMKEEDREWECPLLLVSECSLLR